ncbi:MAG: 16S rRNA (guanine(966)-N(2))-methyltransferase RsmD [Myxococcota bacterium]
MAAKSTGRLRIVAGKWRGRWIDVPEAAARGCVRPVTTRVREAIFSALGRERIETSQGLDLFAGSGSSGLEALSRGAQHVTFVEQDGETCACLKRNISLLSAESSCCVLQQDALAYVLHAGDAKYDLIFVDPPYALRLSEDFWQRLSGFFQIEGLAVVRCHKQFPPHLPDGYTTVWQRCYGDMLVLFVCMKR